MTALSTTKVSKPFDATRDGFVLPSHAAQRFMAKCWVLVAMLTRTTSLPHRLAELAQLPA
jgi:hypothetical protein